MHICIVLDVVELSLPAIKCSQRLATFIIEFAEQHNVCIYLSARE